MIRISCYRLLTAIMMVLMACTLHAQEDSLSVNSNPYEVVYNHLYHLQPDSYNPVLSARSFPSQASDTRQKAIKLKQILDGKGMYLDLNRIPKNENYKDSLRNESVYVIDKNEPRIYLEKINGLWYYSRTTVENINTMHRKIYPFGTEFITKFNAPAWQVKVFGIKLWKWLGIIVILGLSQLVFFIVKKLSELFISKFVKRRIELTQDVKKALHRLSRIIGFLLSIRFILFFMPMFQINPHLNANIIKLLNVLSIFFIILGLKFILKVLFVYFELVTEKTENTLDDQLLPVLYKLSMIILWALGIIYILDYLGVNVTALLAGISIGGLALALAAQDTVKNFFGSIMIFLDKPFQIGDLVEFGTAIGTVEEVGVRSTRIRTLTNSITYVPNAHMADSVINNLGLRIFRRYNTQIAVTYDTSADLIEAFVQGIRKIIEMHPHTHKDNYEVHLNSFADSSLNILVNVFFLTNIWREELRFRHELMVSIIKLAETMGVRFAFPTQTLHIEELPQLGSNNTPQPKDMESNTSETDALFGKLESYFSKRNEELDEIRKLL